MKDILILANSLFYKKYYHKKYLIISRFNFHCILILTNLPSQRNSKNISVTKTKVIQDVLHHKSIILQINKTCVTTKDHWFCDKNLDVTNFLNLNTYTNHDAYCLAYILTYRDFADGTLGLAWVAKPGCKYNQCSSLE